MTPAPPLATPSALVDSRALAEWARADSMRLAAEQSKSAQFMANIATQAAFGRSPAELRNSGMFGEQMAGHLAGQLGGYVSGLMGLSPEQMMMASQNIASTGGMHLTGPNGERRSLSGFGPLVNDASNALFRQMQNQFTVGDGASNLARTHGASLDDVGAAMNALQQHGAFAGTSMGTYEKLTSERLNSLRSAASAAGDSGLMSELEQMKPGDTHISIDPGLQSKVTSWTAETLRSVQQLRSIVGNLPFDQITGEIERLTGVSPGDPSRQAYARSTIGSAVAAGNAAHMTDYESLAFHAATIQSFDASMSAMNGLPTGSYYGFATSGAGQINRAAYAAAAEQQAGAAGGRYKARPMSEIAGMMANDVARLMTEAPEVVEAGFWASKFDDGDSRKRQLLDSMSSYASAGTAAERQASLRAIGRSTEAITGMRSGSAIQHMGSDALLYQTQQDSIVSGRMFQTLMSTNAAAMTGDFGNFVNSFAGSGVANAFGGAGNAAEFTRAMFQQFKPTELQSMQGALQAGGSASEIQARLAGVLKGVSMPRNYNADTFSAQLTQHDANLRGNAGIGLGDYLHRAQSFTSADPRMAALLSVNGQGEFSQKFEENVQDQTMSKGALPDSPLERFKQGLLGGGYMLEDQALLRYQEDMGSPEAKKKLLKLKENADGGLDMTAEDVQRLNGMMATGGKDGSGMDLAAMLGIRGGDQASRAKQVQERLKSKGGRGVLGAALMGGDIVMGGDENEMVLGDSSIRKDHADAMAKVPGSTGSMQQAQAAGTAASQTTRPVEFSISLAGIVGDIVRFIGTFK